MSGYIVKREIVPAVLSRMFCAKCDVEMVAEGSPYADAIRHSCPICGFTKIPDAGRYPALRRLDIERDSGLIAEQERVKETDAESQ